MAWSKWQRVWIGTIVSAPVVAISGKLSLTVLGYCAAEHHFISNQEILDKVIDDVFANYPPADYPFSSYPVPAVRNPIRYATREDFLRANPDCCKIVPSAFVDASEDDSRVPFAFSLKGKNAALVRVIYRVEAEAAVGAASKAMPPGIVRDYRRVTNCGHVTNII